MKMYVLLISSLLLISGCEMLGLNQGGSTPSSEPKGEAKGEPKGERVTSTKTSNWHDDDSSEATDGGSTDTKPAAPSQEVANNIKFAHTSGTTMYERPNITFVPGDWVKAEANRIDKAITDKFNGKDVVFVYEFSLGGKVIATHRAPKKFDIQHGYFTMNVIPNPSDTVNLVHRWDWSGKFAEALGKLSSGKHEIIMRAYVEADDAKTMFARGEMTYDNSAGHGQIVTIAQNIEKNKTFDQQKENEAHTAKYGRGNVDPEQIETTVFNNCGYDVTIRYANQRNSSNTYLVRWRTSMKIVISDMETVWLLRKGHQPVGGPSIGSFEKGKTVNLCR